MRLRGVDADRCKDARGLGLVAALEADVDPGDAGLIGGGLRLGG